MHPIDQRRIRFVREPTVRKRIAGDTVLSLNSTLLGEIRGKVYRLIIRLEDKLPVEVQDIVVRYDNEIVSSM